MVRRIASAALFAVLLCCLVCVSYAAGTGQSGWAKPPKDQFTLENFKQPQVLATIAIGILVLLGVLHFQRTDKETHASALETMFPPGMEASSDALGNLGDVAKAGSLHEFLVDLHRKHGPVASFWWASERVVSVGDPSMLKDTNKLFDRPVNLFALFQPLIGKNSIQYANGESGKRRRKEYIEPAFSHSAVKGLSWAFHRVAKAFVEKHKSKAKTSGTVKIKGHEEMIGVALQAISLSAFGKGFDDEKQIEQIREAYNTCWHDMERRGNGDLPDPSSQRQKDFDAAIEFMHTKASSIIASRAKQIEERKKVRAAEAEADKEGKEVAEVKMGGDDHCFIDDLASASASEIMLRDEVVTMLVGGFHTTGNLLAWALYFLAKNVDVQRKVQQELDEIFGADKSNFLLSSEQLKQLKYTNQVIDETLRCSVLAPWAARESDSKEKIGRHIIPERTPIIQALGVVLQDPKLWPRPETFDPERFSPEQRKRIPRNAFVPFGFAGKRICPGYRFANVETAVFLGAVLRAFDLSISDSYEAERHYGFVTSPKEELPITLTLRR